MSEPGERSPLHSRTIILPRLLSARSTASQVRWTSYLWRFQLFVAGWSSNSQEDQNGAIQPHHILVSKAANIRPDFCFRNSRDLIHHQATNSSQSVGLARLNEESKKRSISWIGSERAQRNRIRHVEPVVLKNHHRTRFSSVVLTARNGPNLAALHVPPQSEMASIKSWSSFA